MKNLFCFFALLLVVFGFYTTTNAQNPKVFFVGHSLVNFDVPNMVQQLSTDAGITLSQQAHIGNGANLAYHWTEPYAAGAMGNNWDTTLAQGGFSHFIMTEAVPLKNHLMWSGTHEYADSFYMYASSLNPNVRTYIYETWHCINSGTPTGCDWDEDDAILWRTRLTQDLVHWEGIMQSLRTKHPSEPIFLLPAGQAMAALHDSIVAGNVPGYSTMNQLFSDDIHLNAVGNYFIACVMFSSINGISPEGLNNQLLDPWGGAYAPAPTPAQAAVLQRIAWRVVCNYANSGVNCTQTSNLTPSEGINLTLFPNPATHTFTVQLGDITQANITVYDVFGRIMMSSNIQDAYFRKDISAWNSGQYFVEITDGNKREFRVLLVE